MSENPEFALVPRSPSGLERVEPGAKRILSGIVADMLEQAKKGPQDDPSPFRIVMICSQLGAFKSLEFLLRPWFKNASFLLLQDSGEAAWQELLRADPDLLITADTMPVLKGSEIVRRLQDRKAKYPIIVATPFARDHEWVLKSASAGLNIQILGMPWTVEDVRNTLEGVGLKIAPYAHQTTAIAPERRKTRPLRVVHVDDESWFLELVGQLIRTKYRDAIITTFQNGDEAWCDCLDLVDTGHPHRE
jgi:CheY-like chemotaxis protein